MVHVGFVIEITPPQLHMHFEELLSAGMFSIRTVGAPGAHGAAMAGIHGIGVSTPSAAAVAAVTIGFARLWHMANGGMLTMGLLSMMLAAGIAPALVLGRITFRVLGAIPNEHCSIAVDTTCWPIADLFPSTIHRSVIFR